MHHTKSCECEAGNFSPDQSLRSPIFSSCRNSRWLSICHCLNCITRVWSWWDSLGWFLFVAFHGKKQAIMGYLIMVICSGVSKFINFWIQLFQYRFLTIQIMIFAECSLPTFNWILESFSHIWSWSLWCKENLFKYISVEGRRRAGLKLWSLCSS